MCSYTFIVEYSIAKFYYGISIRCLVIMISFLMKCCNAKSNSLNQVRIQDKLIVQYFVIIIYNYRSQHAGVIVNGKENCKCINPVSCYVVLS